MGSEYVAKEIGEMIFNLFLTTKDRQIYSIMISSSYMQSSYNQA